MGRLCYPTQAPGRVLVLKPENCHGARRVWRGFCRPGTSFVAYTSVVVQGRSGARNKSRYKKFYCWHWRGRGTSYYKSVMGVGAKAKTMTNNLPILSVLGIVILITIRQLRKIHVFFIIRSWNGFVRGNSSSLC